MPDKNDKLIYEAYLNQQQRADIASTVLASWNKDPQREETIKDLFIANAPQWQDITNEIMKLSPPEDLKNFLNTLQTPVFDEPGEEPGEEPGDVPGWQSQDDRDRELAGLQQDTEDQEQLDAQTAEQQMQNVKQVQAEIAGLEAGKQIRPGVDIFETYHNLSMSDPERWVFKYDEPQRSSLKDGGWTLDIMLSKARIREIAGYWLQMEQERRLKDRSQASEMSNWAWAIGMRFEWVMHAGLFITPLATYSGNPETVSKVSELEFKQATGQGEGGDIMKDIKLWIPNNAELASKHPYGVWDTTREKRTATDDDVYLLKKWHIFIHPGINFGDIGPGKYAQSNKKEVFLDKEQFTKYWFDHNNVRPAR